MSEMYENKTWKIGGELEVNRFGFGAMRITGKGVWGPPANEAEAIRVLQKAVDLGINFMDTADSYGPNVSEELIAKALYPYPENLVIATKGGQERPGPDQWVINGRPEHLKEVLEGSLKRLKLERIDLYQLHRRDPDVPFDETIGFLKEAQDKGQIRFVGLSEVGVESIKMAQKQIEVVSLQNKYSLDYRKWEPELQFCLENDIAFIPWHPIDAGKLKADNVLTKIADKYEATPFQVALKWLFCHAKNILLIPGTSKVSHLEENLQAQEIDLSPEDFELITQNASL
jgi:aryl-alcohol dehydrogenase-like predicted oxidoreductase